MKLELLALKWAVTEKFRDFLLGAQFTVYTDNNPLKYVMSTAKLKAVEQKWVAELSRFNFDIKYRAGRENGNADALSRRPHPEDIPDDFEELHLEEVASLFGVTVIPEDLRADLVKAASFAVQAELTAVSVDDDYPQLFPTVPQVDLVKKQDEDPIISRVKHYLREQKRPTRKDTEHRDVKTMLRQEDRLVVEKTCCTGL
jgi:hypothetical protein